MIFSENRYTSPPSRDRLFPDHALVSAELPFQFDLGLVQARPLRFGQGLARPIDLECQHRKRRARGACLAARAAFGGALERGRDALRITQREDASLEIESVASLGNTLGPSFR